MREHRELGRDDLESLIAATAESMDGPACLYLVGDSSHVAERSRERTHRLDLAADGRVGDAVVLRSRVTDAAHALGVAVNWEHPGDVIPLPDGADERSRATDLGVGALEVRHFDPVSVVFRVVARGDEDDYRLALDYLRAGWVTMDALEGALERTLVHFTRETIQQDPAEFRRKFRGLRQMWLAHAPAG